ncbi:MAG TPA: glycosyltransferase family 4 protein [bacterium]|jgi:glycosyltransferase involved in cell wall biosynthesis
MNLLFVCLSADAADPVHATAVRWIEILAGRAEIDHLAVLTLHAGEISAPPNVTIRVFRGRSRMGTAWKFYREVSRAMQRGIDAFFVYQSGPYPVLLWPVTLWHRLPLYYWKAHPRISTWTWLSARFVATKVFTPTPASLPLSLPNVVVVGHGIDVTRFSPVPGASPQRDIVTIGRVAPVKRVDAMLAALARCNARFGSRLRLDVYGPTLPKDDGYRRDLDRLVEELGLSTLVAFHGPVAQSEVPEILASYRLSLNFSDTALDKAVVESMACGLPVLSTNPAVAEILPPALRAQLIVPAHDIESQAEGMHRLMGMSDPARAEMVASLRRLVVNGHNLEALIGRILQEIDVTSRAHRR